MSEGRPGIPMGKIIACYVEFTCRDLSELSRLRTCVDAMARGKSSSSAEADREWIQYFSDDQLLTFWWPAKHQEAATRQAWGEVPVFKVSPEEKTRDWDIYSLFEVIRESEYELLGLVGTEDGRYRIEFQPDAYPFGGTASLQRLVKAFGGDIVAVDDGTGREEMGKCMLPTPKIPSEPATNTEPIRGKWWQFWK